MRKNIRPKKIMPFLLSTFWVALVLWVVLAPKAPGTLSETIYHYFKRIDYFIYDLKMLSWVKVTRSMPYSIIIVAVDDKSIQQEGDWPWPYDKIANLMIQLRKQGVSVIASDLVFKQAEHNMIAVIKNKLIKMKIDNPSLLSELDSLKLKLIFDDNAQLLEQVMNKNDIVLPFILYARHHSQGVLPNPIAILNKHDLNAISILSMPGYITNFAALQNVSAHNGFISTLTDEDGVVRRTPLVLRYQDKVYPSLPLAVAQVLFPQQKVKLNIVDLNRVKYIESIQLGERKIPTDKAGRVLIPFRGKTHTFQYYSAADVLHNKLKSDALKQAIVFIGAPAAGLASFNNTPVDNAMPNVEIHANVLAGILNNNLPHLPYWAKAVTVAIILALGIILTLALPQLSPIPSILLTLFVLASIVMTNLWFWFTKGIVFPFAPILPMVIFLALTNMACGFFFENRKKNFLREVFSQYVAPDYVKVLLDNPDECNLDGELVELSVLFADIRHFTTISENLNASDLKKLLNQYLTPMTKIIFNYGGTIDKYIGDLIMAFWGAPIKNIHHREAAINAALDMLAESQALKAHFKACGLPEINIGIGINTGLMNVGDMGSVFRRAYTVLGDPVNLGSRLESTTKYYGVNLVVGSATRADLTSFVFRLLDKIKVKGKHMAVDVYEVVCRTSEVSPAMLQEIEAHEKALEAYFAADWVLARKRFQSLADQYPDTVVYSLFIKRIAYFEQNPPPADWDGSYAQQEK